MKCRFAVVVFWVVSSLHSLAFGQSLPTDVEIRDDVTQTLAGIPAACGQMSTSVKVAKLELSEVVTDGDVIVGKAKAGMVSGSVMGPAKTCDVEALFQYIRTSKGWEFKGVGNKGEINPPKNAISLEQARKQAPATAACGPTLPTDKELEADIAGSLGGIPMACGQMSTSVKVAKLQVGPVKVGGDLIIGLAKASMVSGSVMGPAKTCDVEISFKYIRTSKGWEYKGTGDKGAAQFPKGAMALADARKQAAASGPCGASSAYPTSVEMRSHVERALASSQVACGQMSTSISVENLQLGSIVASDDMIVGQAKADMSSGSVLGPAKKCVAEVAFQYIRTSSGWEFKGIGAPGAVAVPTGARPLSELTQGQQAAVSGQTPMQGKWVAHWAYKDIKWDVFYEFTGWTLGAEVGTWAVPSLGCDGMLVLKEGDERSSAFSGTLNHGQGKCTETSLMKIFIEDGVYKINEYLPNGQYLQAILERR